MKTRIAVVSLIALGFAGALFWIGVESGSPLPVASYSQFLQQLHEGNVDGVRIQPTNLGVTSATYHRKDGSMAKTVLPADYRDVLTAMEESSVNIEFKEAVLTPAKFIGNAGPFLTLLAIWAFILIRYPNFKLPIPRV